MKKFSWYRDFNGMLTVSRIYNNGEGQVPHWEKRIGEELVELLRSRRKDLRIPTNIECYPEYTVGNWNRNNMEYKAMDTITIDTIEVPIEYKDEELLGLDPDPKPDPVGPDIIHYTAMLPLRYLVFLYFTTFNASSMSTQIEEWKKKYKNELLEILETHINSIDQKYIPHDQYMLLSDWSVTNIWS